MALFSFDTPRLITSKDDLLIGWQRGSSDSIFCSHPSESRLAGPHNRSSLQDWKCTKIVQFTTVPDAIVALGGNYLPLAKLFSDNNQV